MTAWANYDDVLQQMAAAGLEADALEIGRKVRCRTVEDKGRQRSGWYHLHELHTQGGERLLCGVFGNPRQHGDGTGFERVALRGKTKGLTDQERAALRAQAEHARRQEKERRERIARKAAERAGKTWRALTGLPADSRYLKRKQVGPHGIKASGRGNLVIPICDAHGSVHGLQIIYDDPAIKKRKGRDKDYWPSGLAKQGHFHLIGAVTDVLLVAEGYATGASLHEATGLPVAVAFDAVNLAPVAKACKAKYRHANILVCGDDDWLQSCAACGETTVVTETTCEHCGEPHKKGNTGVASANAAALGVSGAWTVPAFAERGRDKLTDFNDLHIAEGLHTVRAQVERAVADAGWKRGQGAGASTTPGEAGEGGAESAWTFTPESLERGFALIYGTETAFDRERRKIITLGALRAAAGKSYVRQWLESPRRKIVDTDQVVFDPINGDADPSICNLWGGWPTKPKQGNCDHLVELLEYLCSGEENSREVFDWLLRWLAYPIQHPGAKMQTALLMHGPEGTGKNTFFNVVRQIYGEYGCIFSQTELESQFNGWASRKLFAIGNEVVTRVELYQQQGRLKNMITEGDWQINEKNLPTRQEANHCNFVFFSNRIDIAKLDAGDRRYCVVYTPQAADDSFYQAVAAELADGGREALHHYLLNIALEGFTPHSKPPMTRSKRELVDLGMDSTERFWRDFINGDIGVPPTVCTSEDLYRTYQWWGRKEGLPRAAQANTLIASVKKKPGVTDGRSKIYVRGQTKQLRVIWPPGVEVPPDATRQQWITQQVDRFHDTLNDLIEGSRA